MVSRATWVDAADFFDKDPYQLRVLFTCYVSIDKSCLKGLLEDGAHGIMVLTCFEPGPELDARSPLPWVFRDGGMLCGGVEAAGDVI